MPSNHHFYRRVFQITSKAPKRPNYLWQKNCRWIAPDGNDCSCVKSWQNTPNNCQRRAAVTSCKSQQGNNGHRVYEMLTETKCDLWCPDMTLIAINNWRNVWQLSILWCVGVSSAGETFEKSRYGQFWKQTTTKKSRPLSDHQKGLLSTSEEWDYIGLEAQKFRKLAIKQGGNLLMV